MPEHKGNHWISGSLLQAKIPQVDGDGPVEAAVVADREYHSLYVSTEFPFKQCF